MGSETPPGGSGDVVAEALSDVLAADESFAVKERFIPAAHGSALMTPMSVWYSGRSFAIHYGEAQAEFVMWVSPEGLDEIIGALLAAKVRAS